MTKLVLAISAENADRILDGRSNADRRSRPPTRLPARAYLAVSKVGVVGECDLGIPERQGDGWEIPVTGPRRYARPRPLERFGLSKVPRSFQYV